MAEDRKDVAAYIPWKTLLTATEILEQGLPQKLDPSAFPSFSGSIRSWTLSAFRFLGFTDGNGYVQPRLREWVDNPAGRPDTMKDILAEKYPKLLTLAAEHGTVNQMREAIADLGVSGTTAQKAIAFFLRAAEFAGFAVPVTWTKAKLTVSAPRNRARPKPLVKKPAVGMQPAPVAGSVTTKVVRLESGGSVTLIIDANPWTTTVEDREWVFGLVDALNAYETGEALGDDDEEDIDDPDGDVVTFK